MGPCQKPPCRNAGKLLSSFGLGWVISIDKVPPSADMARSPLQPFLLRVTKQQAPHHKQGLKQSQQQEDETDGQVENPDEGQHSGQRRAVQNGIVRAAAVELSFGKDPAAVNAEQLADLLQVTCLLNAARLIILAIYCCCQQGKHLDIYICIARFGGWPWYPCKSAAVPLQPVEQPN